MNIYNCIKTDDRGLLHYIIRYFPTEKGPGGRYSIPLPRIRFPISSCYHIENESGHPFYEIEYDRSALGRSRMRCESVSGRVRHIYRVRQSAF